MRGRVLVTKKCNRRCRGCVNKSLKNIDRVAFEDLLKYEEISITGGEPMLISERVVEMIHRLRFQGYTGKIYLYTTDASNVGKYWGADLCIDEVDGITFTLHFNSNKNRLKVDLKNLRKLDKYLRKHDRSGKSDRLYIDSRIYDNEYAKSLTGGWREIRPLEWIANGECEVPVGEECVFYELEAEG